MPAAYHRLSTSAWAAALAGLLDEAHHLQADHRQHARHQVENQAADERQRDVVTERTAASTFDCDSAEVVLIGGPMAGRRVGDIGRVSWRPAVVSAVAVSATEIVASMAATAACRNSWPAANVSGAWLACASSPTCSVPGNGTAAATRKLPRPSARYSHAW